MATNAAQRHRASRIRGLASLAEAGADGIMRVPLAEVRQRLDLAPLRLSELASRDRWLAGGCVLRWLCGDTPSAEPAGDFDFFFNSRGHLHAMAGQLVGHGYRLRRVSSWRTIRAVMRQRLRTAVRVLRGLPHPDAPPFRTWDSPDAAAWLAEAANRPALLAFEFLTPDNQPVQLVGGVLAPSLTALLLTIDFSICQLGTDGRDLYAGPRTFHDLADHRLRLERIHYAPMTCRRLVKYWRRGFRPDVPTLRRVAHALCRFEGAPSSHGDIFR